MILFSQSDRGQIATDCGKRQARRGLGDPRISGPLNGSQAESPLWADSRQRRQRTRMHWRTLAHPTCPAGSRGPGGPGLKVGGWGGGGGVEWGGVFQASCQHRHLRHGQAEARAPIGFSAKAFPLSGAENSPSTASSPPTPPTCFPQLKQPNRAALFGNILAWGRRERASQRNPQP